MPFQESLETDPNCLCKEAGTLSESTVVTAECDKPQNFADTLFGSEAQQIAFTNLCFWLECACFGVSKIKQGSQDANNNIR